MSEKAVFEQMLFVHNSGIVKEADRLSQAGRQLKIKPRKGKTLIWPVEWTHAHAGEVVTFGANYIATGWMLLPH